ncbi:hypothetical protein OAN79_01290 [Candidatus Pelagibacter sp.]|nr:hypothetical protein [Candidatus Pelagibacter sp.]
MYESTHFGQYIYLKNILMVVNHDMSMESLNRTSDVVQTPSEIGDTPTRVNVDVLKQRIIDQKKKDKFKRNIIFSGVFVSIGVLTILSS